VKRRLVKENDSAACELTIREKVCFEFKHFDFSRFRFHQRRQPITAGSSDGPAKLTTGAQASTSTHTPLVTPHCAPRSARSALPKTVNDVESDKLSQANKRLNKQVKRGRYDTDNKGACVRVVCLHA